MPASAFGTEPAPSPSHSDPVPPDGTAWLGHDCILTVPPPDGITAAQICAALRTALRDMPSDLRARLLQQAHLDPDTPLQDMLAPDPGRRPGQRLVVEFHLLAQHAAGAQGRLDWVRPAHSAAEDGTTTRHPELRHEGPVLESSLTGAALTPEFYRSFIATLLRVAAPPSALAAPLSR